MPRREVSKSQKEKEPSRASGGSGSIRLKTVKRRGHTYEYWEGRCTTGYDPATGKQVQRSVTGKSRKEVAQKLREIAVEVDNNTYVQPSAITVEEWMRIWLRDYLTCVKPSTAFRYRRLIETYVIPQLGAAKLSALNAWMVQRFYNELLEPSRPGARPLAPKSVRDVHGVLHQALKQAIVNGMIRFNPTEGCKLPKGQKTEIKPLEEHQIKAFMETIKGHVHEYLYLITMFTGLREGEVLGLTWDCVDLEGGSILVRQQLRRSQEKGGEYYISSTKNGKKRVVPIGPTVVRLFRLQREKLERMKEEAQELWQDRAMVYTLSTRTEEPYDLVFRNPVGDLLSYRTVYECFKRIMVQLGLPNIRFHDLRHTYAVAAIKSGDDIKTVQSNLGHATAAFTLDVYGHVTEQMKRDSANRMEGFIQSISA